jgi:hypothetical protein
MRPTAVARTFGAFAYGFITHGEFPRFAAKAPAFATLTRIMTPCPFAKSTGIMAWLKWVWIKGAAYFCEVSDIKGLAGMSAWKQRRLAISPLEGEIG